MAWLPAAVRDEHARSFPWSETDDPKGCLHTTESSGWPEYRGWTVMPHATVMPARGKGVTIRQHLPFTQASFALRHTRPQPTNGDYVMQFELIGTCDPQGPRGAYYWPEADDVVLLDLFTKLIKPLDDAFLIPLRAPAFGRYPDRAGFNRMSDVQFDTYSGWHGHQHVPQNDHGDPGAFPWDRMLALAGNPKPKPKPPAPPFTLTRYLRQGNTGSDVRQLQSKVGVDRDGQFGPVTASHVALWQRGHHITADAVVGPVTAKSFGWRWAA
jgi:hypothetical protein